MSLHSTVAAVTDRIVERSRVSRARYLAKIDAAKGDGTHRRRSVVRQSRARLRGMQCDGQGCHPRQREAEHRHRHGVQRHAVGASAVRALSGNHSRGGARSRRDGASRRWRRRDVRRRNARPRRHGVVAVLARRDRAVDGHRAVARHVRCGAVSGHLRQDRAGSVDRRAEFRPSAGHFRAGRSDAERHQQRREIESAPVVRGRQSRPRRIARSGSEVVSLRRHVHVLRHGEFEPDADGDHGSASAGREFRASEHAVARCVDGGSGASRGFAYVAGE